MPVRAPDQVVGVVGIPRATHPEQRAPGADLDHRDEEPVRGPLMAGAEHRKIRAVLQVVGEVVPQLQNIAAPKYLPS